MGMEHWMEDTNTITTTTTTITSKRLKYSHFLHSSTVRRRYLISTSSDWTYKSGYARGGCCWWLYTLRKRVDQIQGILLQLFAAVVYSWMLFGTDRQTDRQTYDDQVSWHLDGRTYKMLLRGKWRVPSSVCRPIWLFFRNNQLKGLFCLFCCYSDQLKTT